MRKPTRWWIGLIVAAALFLASNIGAEAGDAGSGVYGGYVGSHQWFRSMEQSAKDRATLNSLSSQSGMRAGCRPVDIGRKPGCLPPNYVDVAGRVVFPHGNPFPDKQLPNLEIRARDTKADPVERSPYIDANGNFHTVFMRGQTYDLYWVYYFGSREKFASLYVPPKGPSKRNAVIAYTPPRRAGTKPASAPAPSAASAPQAGAGYVPPRTGAKYVPPSVGPGFIAPRVGPGFVPPGSRP